MTILVKYKKFMKTFPNNGFFVAVIVLGACASAGNDFTKVYTKQELAVYCATFKERKNDTLPCQGLKDCSAMHQGLAKWRWICGTRAE